MTQEEKDKQDAVASFKEIGVFIKNYPWVVVVICCLMALISISGSIGGALNGLATSATEIAKQATNYQVVMTVKDDKHIYKLERR